MVLVRDPWKEWEHRFKNLFPSNPTQTDYFRLKRKPGELPKNKFDESVKWFEDLHRKMFLTHYNQEDTHGGH